MLRPSECGSVQPMTRDNRKEQERVFFERAQVLMPELWPTGPTDATKENPDIVVQTQCDRYGVEVTELMNEAVKAHEQRQWRVCSLAQGRFSDPRLKQGIGVMVAFNHGVDLSGKVARDRAVAALIRIVRRSLPPVFDGFWHQCFDCHDELESEFFSYVRLYYHPAESRPIWQPSIAWWVPPLAAEAIALRIADKEGRIPDYLKRADRVFLLLVVYGFDGASAAQIQDEVLSVKYRTAFSGVVLLDYSANRAHCLQTVVGYEEALRPEI